jgi:replicative DNA helicase
MRNQPMASLEAERAVLGAVLSDSVVLEQLKSLLQPEDFSEAKHVHVFTAMLVLSKARTPVDHLTVAEALKALGVLPAVGGPAYLMELDQSVPLASRAVEYARTVRDMALRRKAAHMATQAASWASDLGVPVDKFLSDGARQWASLTQTVKGVRRGPELVLATIDRCEAVQRGEAVTCLSTGIDRWDEVFGGLQPSKLTFIGSQPGVGKSSLLATMVENLSCTGKKVGFFSLEDEGDWVARRLLSKRASIPLFVLATRKLTDGQMERMSEAASSVYEDLGGLVVDDRSMLTPSQVVQSARDMIVNDGVQVIFIDHIGKMDFESRKHHAHDLAIEHGLNELTALAKDYKVPVVIAAHMKEREKDVQFERPTLQSFARTAYIERDARVAVGLYLDRDDPDVLMVGVLKQTEGVGEGDFSLRRLKECGMVASNNGKIRADTYEQAERRMFADRGSR